MDIYIEIIFIENKKDIYSKKQKQDFNDTFYK